jgi:hypothetical protein
MKISHVQLLDCGHISQRACEVATRSDGDVFYEWDFPKWVRYSKRWRKKFTWEEGKASNPEAAISHICPSCWADAHLARILETGMGNMFINKPSGFQTLPKQEASTSRYRSFNREDFYHCWPSNRFHVEHGPSGKIVAECCNSWVSGHNWWMCKTLHVHFEWNGHLWYGRNVFGEHDIDFSSGLQVRRINRKPSKEIILLAA